MDDRNPPKIGREFSQTTVKSVPAVGRLFERGAANRFGVPTVAVKTDVFVRFDFDAEHPCVWHDDYEIQFRPQPTIPRSQVERVENHPVI